MTPTLKAVKESYPDAEIDVIVRSGTEGILKGCSFIRRIYTTAHPEKNKRSGINWVQDLRMLAQIRAQNYDMAIELGNNQRGRNLVALSGANKRCANAHLYPIGWPLKHLLTHVGQSDWSIIHRVEADFLNTKDFLELTPNKPGFLIYEAIHANPPPIDFSFDKPFVVFHPGTRWQRKRWNLSNWVRLGAFVISQNFQIIISVGPDSEEIALGQKLVQAIGSGSISTEGKTQWDHLAWLLYRAKLFVGVDTAAMHLAAATGTPTLALFGPDSDPRNWSPWKTPHRLIKFNSDEASKLHEVENASAALLAL